MGVAEWISIFMAVIAVATAMVTYAVFRSATDPVVIVYAQPDLQRPSIINLIIENIGRGAAHTITFRTSRPLPHQAFGIQSPEKMPEAMTFGVILDGVPFLAPGQRICITWGQYGGLTKYIADKAICVDSFCYRGRRKGLFAKKLQAASNLDVRMFASSESSEHGFGPDLVKQLKTLNSTMTSIDRRLRERSLPD
ncbi:hypothetical protein SJI00_17455 [Pseudomonas sp. RP23018S]|uniref:hypothetical protein n=1 Tax=Pseudomonas sp. RP23018S TaxID=3096037 RepID=UPI002ACABAEE|nr:hypothetical protein [Pseudomonas sp. RP23018S]MDZ5604561.1 hypothetical protein [Pseudomonas sp. RP23018S]